ncbi:HTTM domain-containing protein [Rhodohalobacter mucosus]|uniref:HTTM domain-containing protein n=1 Tax=Rhodohalobacter mucosus TaxID=2079485 RepID=A0A316TQM3_9BACT|nr:HTTM domain-containing protein [Rhodohalobacter mucosus]PWN05315.1 HTTM domain-containing protein [Rhodohalobacter mucosus]
MFVQSARDYLNRHSHAAPLALFRIVFGLLMAVSVVRFAANGWISKLYIEPAFFFSYYGFEWVKPIGDWTYLIFLICGVSALFVMAGFKYRLAMVTFFLSFTYIELMDKTTYLNHYYFISILSFLMIFLPAHAYYSLDARRNPSLRSELVPSWSIDSIKLLLGIVWFYAGLAKLNSEWLIHAMPLAIWLPAKYSIPLLGDLLQKEWVHYLFSWGGALYDLAIPFLLLMKRTRWFAFILVIIFHLLTRVLFPIGMFPYIMIGAALIFFDPGFHQKILEAIARLLRVPAEIFKNGKAYRFQKSIFRKASIGIIGVFFLVQLLMPFRYLLYPGELFWTEEGYRFSWRVMLMEKAGYAQFWVVDPETGTRMAIDNSRFLTPFQEKQMATQPDFILEYAHFLEDIYREGGISDPEIYAESYVALNGRPSRPYVDPERDLSEIEPSFKHRDWILPFNDEIKGL